MNDKPQIISVTTQECIIVKYHVQDNKHTYEHIEVWSNNQKIASGTMCVGVKEWVNDIS